MNDQFLKLDKLKEAVNSTKRISGFTHDFYNYPARFSPVVVREIIETYTEPGDVVLDPFMGGGTTLVESKVLNRHALGFDISTLALFLTSTKTNPPNLENLLLIETWILSTIDKLNCQNTFPRPIEWIEKGYQRNLSNKVTWRIRKTIEQLLYFLECKKFNKRETNFIRCLILRTSQWALDSSNQIPSTERFKEKLLENFDSMKRGALDFHKSASKSFVKPINAPANRISYYKRSFSKPPKLVLTSPPYPGVHVLYHRWQIFGRKETPAPFWIADSLDGRGLTYYAMGSRQQKELKDYFNNIYKSFKSIAKVCDNNTVIIQLVAFKDKEWQLPKYLETMTNAGFKEVFPDQERLWRKVPNRKWHALINNQSTSSNEVVLFHKLK